MVGAAADFTGSALGAIGLTGSVFAATAVDGSLIVPFVFDVLGVFVLLAIIGINNLMPRFVQMKPIEPARLAMIMPLQGEIRRP
jgi:hypothetical protein